MYIHVIFSQFKEEEKLFKESQKVIGVKVFCDRDPEFSPLFDNLLCEVETLSNIETFVLFTDNFVFESITW